MNSAIITSWLLTYLLHSTILLGAAWLVSRALADRRLALQEVLLRMALVGGLITATVQVGFGVEPIGGALALEDLSAGEAVALYEISTADIAPGNGTASAPATSGIWFEAIWPKALLSLWFIGSLLALFVLGRSILDLRRLLKTRRFRPTGRLLDRLAVAMGLRRPVRLSTTAAIAVPFATGIRRPEICCPERVGELAPEHQKSLFAHELAHLARRDPAWQLTYRLGEALLFLQPLNRFIRRRLEEIAEHLTDERAVACTGNRLGLARCLVVVAHWGVADSPGVPATAFAAGPGLDRRVKRLISGTIGQHRSMRWTAPLLVAMLVGSVLLLPAVMPRAVHANLTPTGSDAVKAEPWSPAKPATELPRPTAPPAKAVPAPAAVPDAAAVPFAPAAPATTTEPAPAAVPEMKSLPAPHLPPEADTAPAAQASPSAPEPPQEREDPPPAESEERARAREEARERQRQMERKCAEARARARAEVRVLAAEARELSREGAERSRMTEAEREKLRSEARELMRRAQSEAEERARIAKEHPRLPEAEREKLYDEARELMHRAQLEAQERARIARERTQLTEEEREELWRRAKTARAAAEERMREAQREAWERARALSEEARRLAEEAEAKRLAEEEPPR